MSVSSGADLTYFGPQSSSGLTWASHRAASFVNGRREMLLNDRPIEAAIDAVHPVVDDAAR